MKTQSVVHGNSSEKRKVAHLIIAFIIFWTPIAVFAKIAQELGDHKPIGPEIPFLNWLHTFTNPVLNYVFYFFTTIASPLCLPIIAAALFGFLLYKRQRFNALFLLFSVGGSTAANIILKTIFHRTRPDFWRILVTETDYSFPSGHSMISMALILSLVIILWNTKWRTLSIVLGGFIVIMVGLSRLYLGVHYPTDVIAAWCAGFVWTIVVLLILRRTLPSISIKLKHLSKVLAK